MRGRTCRAATRAGGANPVVPAPACAMVYPDPEILTIEAWHVPFDISLIIDADE
jgi:hypothetical protein